MSNTTLFIIYLLGLCTDSTRNVTIECPAGEACNIDCATQDCNYALIVAEYKTSLTVNCVSIYPKANCYRTTIVTRTLTTDLSVTCEWDCDFMAIYIGHTISNLNLSFSNIDLITGYISVMGTSHVHPLDDPIQIENFRLNCTNTDCSRLFLDLEAVGIKNADIMLNCYYDSPVSWSFTVCDGVFNMFTDIQYYFSDVQIKVNLLNYQEHAHVNLTCVQCDGLEIFVTSFKFLYKYSNAYIYDQIVFWNNTASIYCGIYGCGNTGFYFSDVTASIYCAKSGCGSLDINAANAKSLKLVCGDDACYDQKIHCPYYSAGVCVINCWGKTISCQNINIYVGNEYAENYLDLIYTDHWNYPLLDLSMNFHCMSLNGEILKNTTILVANHERTEYECEDSSITYCCPFPAADPDESSDLTWLIIGVVFICLFVVALVIAVYLVCLVRRNGKYEQSLLASEKAGQVETVQLKECEDTQ